MGNRVFNKFVSIICFILTFSGVVMSWKNVPDEFLESGNIMMATCLGKVPISKETVDHARDFIFPEDGTEEQEHYKCYLKCIFEELGIWKDGIVNVEIEEDSWPASLGDKYRSNHVVCNNTRGKDDCDTAYMTMECFRTNDPDIYFVI